MLGCLKEIGRLDRIEPPPAGRYRKLVVERRPETEKALDCLAERETKRRRSAPVVSRRSGRLLQVVGRRLGLCRVEVLEERRREDLASLSKEDPLLVAEPEDPRQFQGGVTAGPAVRAGQPARCETGATKGWSPGPIGR